MQGRVGRSLNKIIRVSGADGLPEAVEIALIDEVVGEPESGQDLVDQPVRAADRGLGRIRWSPASSDAVSTAWVAAMPLA